MNTKYPINGRVTTLSDIVHEYATSSAWPEGSKYDFINKDSVSTLQPFLTLVFKDSLDTNNKFVAERPYEIVYFDAVYSSTERDSSGKYMKIIQKADCDVFTGNYPGGISGNDYIKAGDVANPINITNGKYGFKFIVASLDSKGQYYYNYRTSSGEATVMYALRNIISLLKLFFQTDDVDEYIKLIFVNGDTIIKNGNIIKNHNLNSEAYKYLGDFIWTYKNVNIKNYTRTEDKILNIAQKYINGASEQTINIDNLFADYTGWREIQNNASETKNNYSYNQTPIYNQLKYYLNIFANSLRFFVSYVTGFRFGKISNKSYLQIEPVLRCDLGVIVLYDSITVSSATHDWHTALPLNAIQEDTPLDIILEYTVKYKNITKVSSPIKVTISLTWKDIITHKEKPDGDDKIWFCLRNVVCDDDGTKKKYIDDPTLFGEYPYDSNSPYFFDIDRMSLKTLPWPINESLLLSDETVFKNIINNPLYNENNIKNYANTADKATFNMSDDEINIKINRSYAPFGTLRMHNFLDKDNEKSGYYCDIDLLRCKNFYMIQLNLKISNININIYYSIPYNTIIPNTLIRLISKTFEEAGNADNNIAINDKSNNIIALQQKELKEDIIYSIPNNSNNEVFITISTSASKTILYASGATESLKSTKTDSYINNLNLELYYLDTTETWLLAEKDKDYIINAYKQSNTLPYYSFKFTNSNKTYVFWKFKFDDIELFLYFRSNNILRNNKQQLSIISLHVYDENSATIELKVKGLNNIDISLLYLIYHANTNEDSYINDTTCLNCFTHAFSSTLHTILNQNAYVNKNQSFYIEPISFKTSDIYQYQEFNITNHNPFNVAYETQITVNSKKIYKFVQCSTLFGKELDNRRVLIDQIANDTLPTIYLAFEPIYIIEFGEIQYSTEKDTKDEKPLVESDCISRYNNNNISLNSFKYKITSGANTTSINMQDANKMNIISLYTSNIFIDSDFLKILDNSIVEDLQDITSLYLISYDVVISMYDFTTSNYVEKGRVSISNGLTKSQINENFYKIKFEPNKQYLTNIIFTKYRKRTGEIACTFSYNYSILNGYLILTITDLPKNYNGTLQKGTTYVGSTQPISLPIGCTVEVKNNYIISDDDKNAGNIKWLGWTHTYDTTGKYDQRNPLTNITIQETHSNISITANIFMNQSVNIKVDNNTNPNPTTPDTSSSNP